MEAVTKLNSMQMFMLKIFDRQLSTEQEQEIKGNGRMVNIGMYFKTYPDL